MRPASAPNSSTMLVRRASSTAFSSCVHTFTQSTDSLLALAATNSKLFAGSQSGLILVWDLTKLSLAAQLRGHQGHILALAVSEDEKWLFSTGDEGLVRVWDLSNVKWKSGDAGKSKLTEIPCVCIIHASADSGDINALLFNNTTKTLYLGCKNMTLQWFEMSKRHTIDKTKIQKEWSSRDSRFFDLPDFDDHPLTEANPNAEKFIIFEENTLPMCHNGVIYALQFGSMFQSASNNVLFTGSGDGTIKIWDIESVKPKLLRTLTASSGSILALYFMNGLLISGAQGGEIKIWDLETFQCIRTLIDHNDDVLCLTGIQSIFFSGSADGTIKKWNRAFECVQSMDEHDGIVLTLCVADSHLVSGGSDMLIKFWDLPLLHMGEAEEEILPQDRMLDALERFVAIPTVSSDESRREDCRAGAKFLRSLLKQQGGETRIVPGAEGKNPLVLAKFPASADAEKCINVLFYGHYDVQPADASKWKFPPFQLTGHDGYVYGRGTTDNKGPIVAMVFAVSELLQQRMLNCNVCFLIEGEEESGSAGLVDAVKENESFFGKVDAVLLSNSYWIDENTPCLTFGLRGVIHANLEITSPVHEDLHSGVDGGAFDEPIYDMIKLLESLVDENKRVRIPGFHESVRPVSEDEKAHYMEIAEHLLRDQAVRDKYCKFTTRQLSEILMARWRWPTFTVHKIDVSGPASNTVIPRTVKATVSMRIVPDQHLETMARNFTDFVHHQFGQLKSQNRMIVSIGQKADWWLAKTEECTVCEAARFAIKQEWDKEPLLIREGGSIPAIPFMEKFFKAQVVHIPLGQSTDNAHLPNERIRMQNLVGGQRVLKNFLLELSKNTVKSSKAS